MSEGNGRDPIKTLANEALLIIRGETAMLPTLAHLKALHEDHEREIVRICHELAGIQAKLLTAR